MKKPDCWTIDEIVVTIATNLRFVDRFAYLLILFDRNVSIDCDNLCQSEDGPIVFKTMLWTVSSSYLWESSLSNISRMRAMSAEESFHSTHLFKRLWFTLSSIKSRLNSIIDTSKEMCHLRTTNINDRQSVNFYQKLWYGILWFISFINRVHQMITINFDG